MTLIDTLLTGLLAFQHSSFVKGVTLVSIAILGLVSALALLFIVTVLLRLFFKRHPVIDRAHKILIYLLTMCGVLLLLIAGLLGLVLPLIPGIPLLFAGLLLMHRYHPWPWLEEKINLAKVKLGMRVEEKVNKSRQSKKRKGR